MATSDTICNSKKMALVKEYASRCRDGICNCRPFVIKMPAPNDSRFKILEYLFLFKQSNTSDVNVKNNNINNLYIQLQCVIHDYLITREKWYKVLARDIFSGTGSKSDVLCIIFTFLKEKCEKKMQSHLDKRYIPYMPLRLDDFGVPIGLDNGELLAIYLKAMFYVKKAVLYNADGDFACWPPEHFKAVYGGGLLGTNISSLYGGDKEKHFLYESSADLYTFNIADIDDTYYDYLSSGPMGLHESYEECMIKGEFSWELYAINGYHHQSFSVDKSMSKQLVLFYKKSAPIPNVGK